MGQGYRVTAFGAARPDAFGKEYVRGAVARHRTEVGAVLVARLRSRAGSLIGKTDADAPCIEQVSGKSR